MDAGVDLVVADFLFASMNVPISGSAPVVLFEHNVEYQIWQRLAALERRPWIRPLLEVEWRKLRAREADACRRADLTIAVSADDRRRLEQLAPGIRAASIPTGVDTDYFTPMPHAERPAHLVFSGSMDWHPNEDAVLYFLESILPRIRAQIPETTFTVVGRNPTARLRDAAERVGGVTVTGTVERRAPVDCGGRGLCRAAPRRRRHAAEDLRGAGHGEAGRLDHRRRRGARHRARAATTSCADEPRAFADAVVSLLRDPERRRRTGRRRAASRRDLLLVADDRPCLRTTL